MQVDLILSNARVITMNPHQAYAGLVAISGDRIAAVAANDVAAFAGPGTRVINCGGKTVIPGFNDAHCHIFSQIRSLLSIDLTPQSVRSIEDIKAAVHWRAEKTLPGRWISGNGFNEFYLAEKRIPNRWDLDEATTRHPVMISHRGLHCCVLNSLALSLAGIVAERPDPPGALIDRDPVTGEPTGILFEMQGYIRHQVMPHLSEEEVQRGMAAVNRLCLENGITSVQDASVTNNLARWNSYKTAAESGCFQPRISLMFGLDAVSDFREAGMVSGSGDEHLRLGPIKMLVTEATGQVEPDQPRLNMLVQDYTRAGFQIAIHAVQENTVAAAISALETVGADAVAKSRHRIEHCSECPPALLKRLKKIRPVIVTQPSFLYYSGERYLTTVEPRKIPWLYRIKSFMNAGLTVAASSDTPSVPGNPLVVIYAAVPRKAESGQYLCPEQGILVSKAIAAYTVNAAYASFEDDIKGTIAPGMLADMVVLNGDPLRVPKIGIKDIQVDMTIIGGKVVWER